MSWKFQLVIRPYGGVSEGPVWDGEAICFTHIPTSRIMKYDPATGGITTSREGTNHTNGLAHDTRGNLYGCCSGGRAIVRFNSDGSTTTVADRGGRPETEHSQRPGRGPAGTHLVHQPVERRQHRPQRGGGTGQPLGRSGRPPARRLLHHHPGHLRHHHAERDPGLSQRQDPLRRGKQQRNVSTWTGNCGPIRSTATGAWAAPTTCSTLSDGTPAPSTGASTECAWTPTETLLLPQDGNWAGPDPCCTCSLPPDGSWRRTPISCNRPTNCCFGGPGLSTIFVTSTDGHFYRAETDRIGWALYP